MDKPKPSVRQLDRCRVPRPDNAFYQLDVPDSNLDIEIGCGVGLHPLAYARAHPERNLVAIEHTKEKYQKFVGSSTTEMWPDNLLPIHANAVSWVTHKIKPDSVDHYFLLYPNPNPKPRDLGRRWHAMPFAEVLIETLKIGGQLCLASNLRSYIEEAKVYFVQVWGLKIVCDEVYVADDLPWAYRTHFERKYLERGESCYDVVFEKF